jgi:hypothetical protein
MVPDSASKRFGVKFMRYSSHQYSIAGRTEWSLCPLTGFGCSLLTKVAHIEKANNLNAQMTIRQKDKHNQGHHGTRRPELVKFEKQREQDWNW